MLCIRVRVSVSVLLLQILNHFSDLYETLCAHYTFWVHPSALLLDLL